MDLEAGGDYGQLLALPQCILESIVHRAGLHVRLVCKRLLEAYVCKRTRARHLRMVPGLGRSELWDGAPAMDIPHPILAACGTSLQQVTLHVDQLGSKGLEEAAALLRSGAVRLANLQQLAILRSDAGCITDPERPQAGQLAAAVLDAPGGCGNLRSLKVSGSMLWWTDLAALTAALMRATQLAQLQCLDLSDHCRKHWSPPPTRHTALEEVMVRATHLSNLQELLLRGASYMLPVATAALASGNFPKLRTLDLINSTQASGELRALLEALRGAPHASALRELRLGFWAASIRGPADGQDIVTALCHGAVPWQPLSGLTLLHLGGIGLSADSLATLAAAVSRACCLQALAALHVNEAALEGAGGVHLAGCLRHLPALRELNLADSSVSSEGVLALVMALAGSPHLASSLEVLGLPNCTVDFDEAASLAAVLRGGFGAALRHLALAGTDAVEAGCRLLSAALLEPVHLARLTSLHVGMFFDPEAYQRSTARLVVSALQARHLTGLMEVRLEGLSGQRYPLALVDALAAATHLSPGLQSLQLSCCELGDRGMARLCAALAEAVPGGRCRHLAGLRVLLLDSNGIGDVGAACLAAALGAGGAQLARLQHLSLMDNDGITGEGVALLGDALGRARQLQELRVLDLGTAYSSRPQLTGVQAEALAAALRINPFLPNLWALRVGKWQSEGFPTW